MKKQLLLFLISLISTLSFSQQIGTTWQFVGPIKFPVNGSGQINGLGRVTSLKFDPILPNRMYATSASGGLWRSNDTSQSWLNVNTDNLPDMQCASICIDHTNNNILYLGSGDPNYYSQGFGVWKSTNGGANWVQSTSGISTGLIVELIMDPTNNQAIIAATNNGIFKTTNAGVSWTNVKSGGDFKAMLLKPFSHDTVYAVTSSQVWRSVNFGTSWQQIANGVNVPGGTGLGMRLAVSKANPNVVYVGMIKNEGLILKSIDGGTSFTTVYNNPAQSLVGYNATTPGQGDYNFGMNCDPNNANIVYVVAHCVWKSTDGGITWTQLTNWYADCHTDMHGIVVHPTYNSMLFNVNDGGLFISRNAGTNWAARCNGLSATEIYSSGQSNVIRDELTIGTQDNGELFNAPNNWVTNRGGDWGSLMPFEYMSSNRVYYLSNGKRRTVAASEVSYNSPFTPTNLSEMVFNRKLPNQAFLASQAIYRSTNMQAVSPTWVLMTALNNTVAALHTSFADSSMLYAVTKNNLVWRCDNALSSTPNFTSYATPTSTSVKSNITSIKTNSNVVVLTCGGTVYRSTNKGQTFTNYSTGLPGGLNILKLIHDEYSTDEGLFACMGTGVYYRNINMSAWQNVNYNLPTIASITDLKLFNDGTPASALRVSTYGRGVWELPINQNLAPAVQFTSNKKTICVGDTVKFNDVSFSNITTHFWSFPGGSPATSTLANPVVVYPTAGNYAVTLVSGNANGTNTLTQNAYISVISTVILPIQETFSATPFPPQNWALYDDASDGFVWQRNTSVGGYGLSTECTFFDNFNLNVNGKRDGLVSRTYNLIGVTNPKLYFDVAYARYSNSYYDTLAVRLSTNCGQTYTMVYLKGNTALATSPDNSSLFIPTNTQWRTDTVNLSAFVGQPQIQIEFQNRGGWGNYIYLDNINLTASLITTNVKSQTNISSSDCLIYPNPSSGIINVNYLETTPTNKTIIITDNLGKEMYRTQLVNENLQIDASTWAKGIYFLNSVSKNGVVVKKVVLQ
jgi:photosystem II stability/assembly factor-like uncharacterized protein